MLEHVVEDSVSYFAVDRAAVWLWDSQRERPLALAASRSLPEEVDRFVGSVTTVQAAPWVESIRQAGVLVFGDIGRSDTPESVNQALWEAVNKVSWNPSRDALKILFLVGEHDAITPPEVSTRAIISAHIPRSAGE